MSPPSRRSKRIEDAPPWEPEPGASGDSSALTLGLTSARSASHCREQERRSVSLS